MAGRPHNYAPGIARREAIMAAAFEAFGSIGYWNTSLKQIAEDCGVTRAGLIHHFHTKESLLEAVLHRRDTLHQKLFFEGQAGPHEDPRDFLRRVVLLVADNASQAGLVDLFAVLSTEATQARHPAHAYFSARYERVRGAFRDALAALRESGGLREGVDIDRGAVELVAIMDGLQVQWLYTPALVDMPQHLLARLNELLVEPLRLEPLPDSAAGDPRA